MVQIRAYGFLANANKKQALAAIRRSLGTAIVEPETEKEETAAEKILRLTGLDITCCPQCGDQLIPGPLPLPERPP